MASQFPPSSPIGARNYTFDSHATGSNENMNSSYIQSPLPLKKPLDFAVQTKYSHKKMTSKSGFKEKVVPLLLDELTSLNNNNNNNNNNNSNNNDYPTPNPSSTIGNSSPISKQYNYQSSPVHSNPTSFNNLSPIKKSPTFNFKKIESNLFQLNLDPLDSTNLFIGRKSKQVDITLPSKKNISRKHAIVSYSKLNNKITLKCLGLNGLIITLPKKLSCNLIKRNLNKEIYELSTAPLLNIFSEDTKQNSTVTEKPLVRSRDVTSFVLLKDETVIIPYIKNTIVDFRQIKISISLSDESHLISKIDNDSISDTTENTVSVTNGEVTNKLKANYDCRKNLYNDIINSPITSSPMAGSVPLKRTIADPQFSSPPALLKRNKHTSLSANSSIDTSSLSSLPVSPIKYTSSNSNIISPFNSVDRSRAPSPKLNNVIEPKDTNIASITPIPSFDLTKKKKKVPTVSASSIILSKNIKPNQNLKESSADLLTRKLMEPSNSLKKADSIKQLKQEKAKPQSSLLSNSSSSSLLPPIQQTIKAKSQDRPTPRIETSKTPIKSKLENDIKTLKRHAIDELTQNTRKDKDTHLLVHDKNAKKESSINSKSITTPIISNTDTKKNPSVKVKKSNEEIISEMEKSGVVIEDLQNILINYLAYGNVQQIPLFQLAKVNKQIATLKRSQVRALLAKSSNCIGVIYRSGKDAAGKPLDEEYYYDLENDSNQERRNLVLSLKGGRTGLRSCRKTHKQYFWKKPK
ncbi:hypothetical protein TBLA_0A05240 [Henningerozyma blattae CBS 6284]|uniref:FHA domain-containing protein n=1 Tax=Henningerozyma blattae (strain ATCC 34711 / CBS 6284 / DSM 70876 / NBRC 10599 / NRRL Y-10934 / UCD 77-7) TaxID=1071380 RepID=I2GW15_HENB6|nr:hypothetical protein TBLA_0A05240 [Tetrapisispora blattae CBS 6284]CCH58317.1 hypothetical protein TBLA_0A05240 [Tetrapisispora blattae CBS 6284]